jgi:hypothetical protein
MFFPISFPLFSLFFLQEPATDEELLKSSGITPIKSLLQTQVESPGPDFVCCTNCANWVPENTAFRHEAFCKRNLCRCEVCQAVIQVAQRSFHYHCPVCTKLVTKEDHMHCSVCNRGLDAAHFATHAHCPSCKLEMEVSQVPKHVDLFHTASLKCECGRLFEFEALRLHKELECSLRMQKCMYCENQMEAREIDAHQKRCGAETVRCDVCLERVPRSDAAAHAMMHSGQ